MKYIGYYVPPNILPKRSISPAGRNKMDYTADIIRDLTGSVEIISPAPLSQGEKCTLGGRYELALGKYLRLFPNVSAKTKLGRQINARISRLSLFSYLLCHTKKNEPILVYHSLVYSKLIRLIKRITGCKIILELNEIYSEVSSDMASQKDEELKIIDMADAFIFPNDLMNEMFNIKGKPHSVEYGIYRYNQHLSDSFEDGKIHVVYAGTLDETKGGCHAAAAATYLPESYHVHILGFGTDEQVNRIKKLVTSLRSSKHAELTYDGLLDGDNFISFLQKCQIGLSPQDPHAIYNETSFPSKVLTYMSNGLKVVSIDIKAISSSQLKDNITFYKNQTPLEIASAILAANDKTTDYTILNRLDAEFRQSLKSLLSEL